MTKLGSTGVSEVTDTDADISELLLREDRLNPATLAIWQADTSAQAGDVVRVNELTSGNGGGFTGKAVSGTTPGLGIFIHGSLSISLVMENEITLGTENATIGLGTKGNPQTNVGVQINRDIDASTNPAGTSSHGFNDGTYFAEDTFAYNTFGSDLQIGDGTQTTEVLNHVNDFQSTNKVNLGSATISAMRGYTAQSLLESGTIPTVAGVTVVDVLGGRDTPGFSTPNFEVDGAAVVNNQTGIGTLIRHGINPRSIHCAAGNTDAGALLTSGGAPVDLECPVTIRQATATTNTLSGALICTAGGMSAVGAIFGGGQISVVDAQPIFRLRDAVNAEIGRVFHDGAIMRVYNTLNNELHLGINGASKVEVQTDRFIPSIDDDLNLGDSTHRWKQLFATTATISTSDANTKDNILPIDDALLDAWADVEHVIFQFKDALTVKGEGARLHAGHIAQQVQSALEAKGLDGFRYALLCNDELKHKVKKIRTVTKPVMKTTTTEAETFEKNSEGVLIRKLVTNTSQVPKTEQLQVFNEDGSPFMAYSLESDSMTTVIQTIEITEEIKEEYEVEELSGKFRMGLRYEQCLIVGIAYLRREIARLKSQITPN